MYLLIMINQKLQESVKKWDYIKVKAGQKLLGFDRDAIAKAGYNDTVVMLLTNSDDLEGVECGLK